MDKIITLLGERFLNFFTRSVAPSSIFFVLLFLNDNFFNSGHLYCQFSEFLQSVLKIDKTFLYICLVLIFLAYGYINQVFTQILDNLIKKNYCFFNNDSFEKWFDKDFSALRDSVKTKLSDKEKEILESIGFNDYNNYQVLGKTIEVSASYVDEVKSIHSLCVAIVLNISIYEYINTGYWMMIFLMFAFTTIIFHGMAILRYKARNKRLYINYLLSEKTKNPTYKIVYKGRSDK